MKKITLLVALALPLFCYAANPIHCITKGKKIRIEERTVVADHSGIYFVHDGKAYSTKCLRHDKKGLFVFSREKKFLQKWHDKNYQFTLATE